MVTSFRRWKKDAEPWYAATGLASLVMGTSSVLVPLMIAEVLGQSVLAVGLLSSAVSLVGVIGSLIWGRLSDAAARRKPFIVLSYAMLSVSFLGTAISHAFGTVLAWNMVLNFFWMANASITVLIVIENRDKSMWETQIGHLNQIISLGWLAGLALGSISLGVAGAHLGEEGAIRALFVLLALSGAGAALLAGWFVPRTTPKFTRRRFRGVIVALGNFLVESGRFRPAHLYHRLNPRRLPELLWGKGGLRHETKLFLWGTFLAFTGFGFFFVPLPVLLSQGFGFPSSTVFLYFVVLNAAIVVAYPFVSQRIKKVGNRSIQLWSLLVRLGLFALLGAYLTASGGTPSTAILVLYFLVLGASWSFFQLSGVALASRLAKPENRGQALGLYNAVAGLGTIFAGLGSGILADRLGYGPTLLASALLIGGSIIVLHRLPAPRPVQKKKADRKPLPEKVVAKPVSSRG